MPELQSPQVSESPPRKRRWLRRFIWSLAAIVVLTPFVSGGIYFYDRYREAQALAEAIAETDRLDPGWRLEDIERHRAILPADQNAAIYVVQAAFLIPFSSQKAQYLFELASEPPQFQIDSSTVTDLTTELGRASNALTLAEKILPLRTGRYIITWGIFPMGTQLPHLDDARKLSERLNWLAILNSQICKNDEAWQTSLTILAVSRSFSDEPTLISQLFRCYTRTKALACLERCLAQGQVSDDLLAEAQRLLLQDSLEPNLYYGLRGERANSYLSCNYLEAKNISAFAILRSTNPPLLEHVGFLGEGRVGKHVNAWNMKHLYKAVTASKLPPKELRKEFEELQHTLIKERARAVHNLTPNLVKLGETYGLSIAYLYCATTAIAVERFRLKNNRWPESLDEVVTARLLDKVPEDPYDGKPLRYRKTTDGVVVYSIGKDGKYAGDALDAGQTYDQIIVRYEFRLWGETHRRQPPRPKVEDKKDGGSP